MIIYSISSAFKAQVWRKYSFITDIKYVTNSRHVVFNYSLVTKGAGVPFQGSVSKSQSKRTPYHMKGKAACNARKEEFEWTNTVTRSKRPSRNFLSTNGFLLLGSLCAWECVLKIKDSLFLSANYHVLVLPFVSLVATCPSSTVQMFKFKTINGVAQMWNKIDDSPLKPMNLNHGVIFSPTAHSWPLILMWRN